MTLSAGQVSLGVHPDTKGFGAKLHEGVMAESGGLFGIGKELGGHLMEGLGAIGIAVGVGEFIKKGVEEYSAADALNAQFAAGIKSTNNAAGLSVKSMDELAASVSGYSGQAYDSIGKTEQVLQTFTNIKNVGPDKIFDDTTVAAANMAAKLGGDASSQAIQLGKALNDPVKGMTALRRVGVAFTADQTKQVDAMVKSGDVMGAQKVILGELNTEFGGAAKAAGQTLPGEINRSKVAFGELTKAVMTGVMPFVTPIIGSIADAMNKATPHIEHFGEIFQEKLAKVGEAFHALTNLVVKGDFSEEFRKAFHVEEDSPVVGVILGIRDGVIGAFKSIKSALAGVDFAGIWDSIKSAAAPIGAIFAQLGPALGPLIPQIVALATAFSPFHLILKAVQPMLPQLVGMFGTLAGVLSKTIVQALEVLVPLFVQLSGVVSQALSGVFAAVLPVVVQLVTQLAGTLSKLLPVVMPIIGTILQLAGSLITQLAPIITHLITAILPPVVSIFGMILKVITPLIATIGELLIPIIKMLMPIVVTVFSVISSVIQSAMQIVLGVIEVVTGIITGNWSQVWQGIQDVFSGIWNTIVSIVSGALSIVWSVISSVFNTISGFIGGAVQGIGDAIGNVFGGIGATIRGAFDGVVGFIRGVINSVIDVVNGAASGINGFIDLADKVPGVNLPHVGTIPHLATGGTIRTPGTALVGENGPEVVSLPAGATVYPTGTGPSSGRGDTNITIYEAHNATATAQTVMQRITARKV